jgi:hypothetical protein
MECERENVAEECELKVLTAVIICRGTPTLYHLPLYRGCYNERGMSSTCSWLRQYEIANPVG